MGFEAVIIKQINIEHNLAQKWQFVLLAGLVNVVACFSLAVFAEVQPATREHEEISVTNSQTSPALTGSATAAVRKGTSPDNVPDDGHIANETNLESEYINSDQNPLSAIKSSNTVPRAESVDLSEPISVPEASAPDATDISPAPTSPAEIEIVEAKGQVAHEPPRSPLIILGAEVSPGTSTRLSWKPDQSFEGIAAPTPVLVVNGLRAGPTLCLTAAIHGDELNGIEIVRRVLYEADPKKLTGTLIGVPIVNLHGFHRTSRYLPDRRDLNRFFPGNATGSSASRIAHSFFNEVIGHCDALVDLHTGSFRRTNLPQVRADLTDAAIVELSQSFGATVVLHNAGMEGTLRRAAADARIPAITLEAGEPMRLQQTAVNHGVKGIETLLNKMGMYKRVSFWGDPEPVFYRSEWIRSDQGGILFSEVNLGERVREGELLGTVTDPITNVRAEIHSPFKGRILGRALDQVVMPGFAAFRIGIETSEEDMQEQMPEATDILEGEDARNIEAAKIIRNARSADALAKEEQIATPELSE